MLGIDTSVSRAAEEKRHVYQVGPLTCNVQGGRHASVVSHWLVLGCQPRTYATNCMQSTALALFSMKNNQRTPNAPEHEPEDEAQEGDPHVALRPPAPASDLLEIWARYVFGRGFFGVKHHHQLVVRRMLFVPRAVGLCFTLSRGMWML